MKECQPAAESIMIIIHFSWNWNACSPFSHTLARRQQQLQRKMILMGLAEPACLVTGWDTTKNNKGYGIHRGNGKQKIDRNRERGSPSSCLITTIKALHWNFGMNEHERTRVFIWAGEWMTRTKNVWEKLIFPQYNSAGRHTNSL